MEISFPPDMIPITEIFGPVIQGEGLLAGSKTMFVRVAGCDSRCRMCDSIHAVDPIKVRTAERMSTGQIATRLRQLKGKQDIVPWVTLSGGNPALYNLTDLVTLLHSHGFKVAVETQGTVWKKWLWTCDVVTCSPKGPGMDDPRGRSADTDVLDDFIGHMHASKGFNLKIVCFDGRDLQFAKFLRKRYQSVPMFLSVGNPYIGHNAREMTIGQHRNRLLTRYQWLVEEALKIPELYSVTILPQLHVLMYGNEEGR